MDSPPLLGLPSVWISLIHSILLGKEGELHLDILMDLVIIFEDNVVIELGVGLVPHNPVNLQLMLLILHMLMALLVKLI